MLTDFSVIGLIPNVISNYSFGIVSLKGSVNLFAGSLVFFGVIMLFFSVVLTGAAQLSARGLAWIFASYDAEFLALSTRALRLYFIAYFFAGINVFGSGLFAALNNGPLSGLLSALRLFVFQLSAVLLLPLLLGSDGIWLAMPVSEFCVMIVTIIVFAKNRKKYQYA